MSDTRLYVDNIKREIAKNNPSTAYVLNCLKDLKSSELTSLSDEEYCDILGEIFKLNPIYYMTSLYPKLKTLKMARYLVEKFSLYENERIIYEFPGKIKQSVTIDIEPVVFTIKSGIIYVTNLRIIAHGKLTVTGGSSASSSPLGLVITTQIAEKGREKAKKRFFIDSISHDLPCYGYQIKSRNNVYLRKKKKSVKYLVLNNHQISKDPSKRLNLRKSIDVIKIIPPKPQVGELYDILRKDVDHTVEMFQEANDKIGLVPPRDFGELWKSEEYKDFSDSSYIDIAMKVYELNTGHFMTKIYPRMQNWKLPSFLKIKDLLFEKLLEKEG